MHPVTPIFVSELFPPLRQELLTLLHSLSPSDWERATPCSGWTVKDLVAHLLDGDLRRLSLQGDGLPPRQPARPLATNTDLIAFLDQLNAVWVEAARRLSPPLLVDLLAWAGPQLSDHFRTLDPFAPALFPVAWAGEQTSQNWFDSAREYTEKWHHQQHIRQAVDAPLLNGRQWLYPVLDTFIRAAPFAWQSVEAAPGTQVLIEISGEAGAQWTLCKQESAWHLYAGRGEAPAAVARFSDGLAWRLFTKGITPEEGRRHVEIHGDPLLAQPLFKLVSIMA
ncbi:MAG: maleylpyruvate isomerase family mycothiol-dependent enzyme [Chloroflexi bacterium]|nr:maleylpyruvate isomerase family mycothiol-dependent enzyme [Chloroflexota bacterium]